jgi:uncharacterized membrane protein (DUF485 family)
MFFLLSIGLIYLLASHAIHGLVTIGVILATGVIIVSLILATVIFFAQSIRAAILQTLNKTWHFLCREISPPFSGPLTPL